MDARRYEVGYIKTIIRSHLHSIENGIASRHTSEILNCAIGTAPTDMASVRFVPDDRAIRFDSDAVREHGAGKFDQDARDPIGRQREYVTRIGIARIVGPGIGDYQTAIGGEDEIVGTVEGNLTDFGDYRLGLAPLANPLD